MTTTVKLEPPLVVLKVRREGEDHEAKGERREVAGTTHAKKSQWVPFLVATRPMREKMYKNNSQHSGTGSYQK